MNQENKIATKLNQFYRRQRGVCRKINYFQMLKKQSYLFLNEGVKVIRLDLCFSKEHFDPKLSFEVYRNVVIRKTAAAFRSVHLVKNSF